MTYPLFHVLIMYVLPVLCGFVVGSTAQRCRCRWYWHMLAGLLTVAFSLFVQYVCLLVMVGIMQGTWPAGASLDQWIYGIFWFAIPGIFLASPGVLAGYLIGAAMAVVRQSITPTVTRQHMADR